MTEQEIYRSLVYSRKKETLLHIERLVAENQISRCLLALCYVIYGRHNQARKILAGIQSASQIGYCVEAKMLLDHYDKKTADSILLAEYVVENFSQAAFAHFLLARCALLNGQLRKALEHYEIISREYPDHPRLPFYIAETLAYLGDYSEAMTNILSAPPSFQRFLYRLLLPLAILKYRLVLGLGFVVLFVISSWINITWAFFIFTLLSLLFGAVFFMKKGSILLLSRFFNVLIRFTIIWLALWILWVILRGS